MLQTAATHYGAQTFLTNEQIGRVGFEPTASWSQTKRDEPDFATSRALEIKNRKIRKSNNLLTLRLWRDLAVEQRALFYPSFEMF